ncbi:DUF3617 domain-containing protein [Pseudomonas gingeri]|uniref:DUF3617 domain-containing protein n=1 Tax=Pseudomonas gingeri TaxID=117681 RepID=A0A7Y7Y715_9PSED|nr:DUF3617 domain-containing protein [Pseudomonas gingeri]NWA04115.1 DUF3617 domain-containing protein [Pseudomonas gingeri]NWA15959.1 DUF3617 domain-containing protein [Pseudomonas gingeri]NWA58305.1 DUF3617 domain-containing protein [Pseudomonas gingeri]NWA99323.1 DUF3617 domain-containing protein [Pseudomonas gingeri]NWB05892.1 DUF3617 domain-containing protein [Pseudomonas gingeri]
MNLRLPGLAIACAFVIPVAQAQVLQPGLWELTSSNVQVENQSLDVGMLLGVLKQNTTPEQRAALEKQGINLGGQGVRMCLTPQQVASESIPLTDPQSGCSQQITERNGPNWKFKFSCPKAQGAGTAHFVSDREFTTQVSGTFNATGIQQNGSMDTKAVWLGQDCGAVKPRS